MSEEKFNTGDVVQLMSGGPRMTVTACEPRDGKLLVWVIWFEGEKGDPKSSTFPAAALERM